MREIKFRAKRVDNNEWVYGYYCKGYNMGTMVDSIMVIYKQEHYLQGIQIKTETLGQFIGLHDENDNEIYEGDIVFIETEDEQFKIQWDKQNANFSIIGKDINADFDNFYSTELVVVGNVYD